MILRTVCDYFPGKPQMFVLCKGERLCSCVEELIFNIIQINTFERLQEQLLCKKAQSTVKWFVTAYSYRHFRSFISGTIFRSFTLSNPPRQKHFWRDTTTWWKASLTQIETYKQKNNIS